MVPTIVNLLNHRQNVLIQSLPGMGLNSITRKITHSLNIQNNSFIINIYPHESAFDTYPLLESLLLSKLKIENKIDSLSSVSELTSYLDNNSQKLIIVLNKIHEYVTPAFYLDYFDSLHRSAPSIALLVTSNLEIYSRMQHHPLLISCRPFIFPGFTNNYLEILFELASSFNCSVSAQISNRIFDLCLGHTGLIKSLVQSSLNSDSDLTPSDLLTRPQIKQRLSNIFSSLEPVYPDINHLWSQKQILTDLGLMYHDHIGELFQYYFDNFIKNPEAILSELTVSEKAIYHYLTDHNSEFTTINQILLAVSSSAFDTKTDWTIYKHINNLNKKLEKYGKTIINHRAKGYQLALIPKA